MPRLIPFIFSSQQASAQAAALVMIERKMQVAIDGAYVLNAAETITGITQASPGVVSYSGADYSDGDVVYITGVQGMTQLNGRYFQVLSAGVGYLSLSDIWGNPLNTTAFGAYISGGTIASVYTLVTPYAEQNLLPDPVTGEPGIKFSQSADEVTITHPLYAPHRLTRFADNNWTIEAITFASKMASPTHVNAAYVWPYVGPVYPNGIGYLARYFYAVTSISQDGKEESLPQIYSFTSGVIDWTKAPKIVDYLAMSMYAGTKMNVSWTPVTGASGYNIYRTAEVMGISKDGGAAITPDQEQPPVTALFGLVGTAQGASFVDQNTTPDFSITPPNANNPFADGRIISATVLTAGSGYSPTVAVDLEDATGTDGYVVAIINPNADYTTPNPATQTITSAAVLWGGQNYTTPSITCNVIDLNVNFPGHTPGSGATIQVNVSSPQNYPGVCAYYQQRLFFAATSAQPDTLWATQVGNYNNMNTSPIIRDSDAITATLAAGGANAAEQVNRIQHLVPVNIGMAAITAGNAYAITGGGPNTAITPSSIQAQPQAYSGASDLRPIAVGNDILVNNARGNAITALKYNFFFNNFSPTDVSFVSNHLFWGRYITDWCYAEQPWKTIWAVRDDGVLLSCAYLPEQEVSAWTRHDTFGKVVSVCSIPEGTENRVYLIVERTLNGQTVFTVERMASRYMGENPALNVPADPEQAWFLDCAQQLSHTYPAASLTCSAASGSAVTLTASAAVFSSGNVGNVVRVNGGIGVITSVTDTQNVVADFSGTTTIGQPMTNLVPNSGLLTDAWGNTYPGAVEPFVAASGDWTMDAPVTSVSALDVLDGATVWGVADGKIIKNLTVTGGVVTLPNAATSVILGLPYQCQFQPIRWHADQAPVEGKMKQTSELAVWQYQSRNLKAGPDFSTVTYLDDITLPPAPLALEPVQSGVTQKKPYGPWLSVDGFTCFQVDDPMPVHIVLMAQDLLLGDSPP